MKIDEKAFRIIVSTPAKDIAKRTGLTRDNISRLRARPDEVQNLPYKTLVKLTDPDNHWYAQPQRFYISDSNNAQTWYRAVQIYDSDVYDPVIEELESDFNIKIVFCNKPDAKLELHGDFDRFYDFKCHRYMYVLVNGSDIRTTITSKPRYKEIGSDYYDIMSNIANWCCIRIQKVQDNDYVHVQNGLTPVDYTIQTFVWGYNIAKGARISTNEYASAVTEEKEPFNSNNLDKYMAKRYSAVPANNFMFNN